MRRFHLSCQFVLAVCALAALPLSGRAQTQALDFASGVTRFDYTIAGASSWTVGYQFTTSGDVTVYNLGFYDSGLSPHTDPGHGTLTGPDGLSASHDIGIYNSTTGKLLVQATVPRNSTLLDSNFRYAAGLEDAAGNALAAPYTLQKNGTYIIVGVSNGENFTYVQNAHDELTHDLHVAFLHSVYQAGTSLFIPNTQDATAGYFGPNFTTSEFLGAGPITSVPEPTPTAFAACLLGAGLLWRAKRLRLQLPKRATLTQ